MNLRARVQGKEVAAAGEEAPGPVAQAETQAEAGGASGLRRAGKARAAVDATRGFGEKEVALAVQQFRMFPEFVACAFNSNGVVFLASNDKDALQSDLIRILDHGYQGVMTGHPKPGFFKKLKAHQDKDHDYEADDEPLAAFESLIEPLVDPKSPVTGILVEEGAWQPFLQTWPSDETQAKTEFLEEGLGEDLRYLGWLKFREKPERVGLTVRKDGVLLEHLAGEEADPVPIRNLEGADEGIIERVAKALPKGGSLSFRRDELI